MACRMAGSVADRPATPVLTSPQNNRENIPPTRIGTDPESGPPGVTEPRWQSDHRWWHKAHDGSPTHDRNAVDWLCLASASIRDRLHATIGSDHPGYETDP